MSPWSRVAATFFASAVLLMQAAAPSLAYTEPGYDAIAPTGNYGYGCAGGHKTCMTDNKALFYAEVRSGALALESEDIAQVRSTMSDQYGPTELSVAEDSSPVLSGSAQTDVWFEEGTVDGGDEGSTYCAVIVSGATYRCDRQIVRIEGAGAYYPGLTCHETGHAVGLLHGDEISPALSLQESRLGCMKKTTAYGDGLGVIPINNINWIYQ